MPAHHLPRQAAPSTGDSARRTERHGSTRLSRLPPDGIGHRPAACSPPLYRHDRATQPWRASSSPSTVHESPRRGTHPRDHELSGAPSPAHPRPIPARARGALRRRRRRTHPRPSRRNCRLRSDFGERIRVIAGAVSSELHCARRHLCRGCPGGGPRTCRERYVLAVGAAREAQRNSRPYCGPWATCTRPTCPFVLVGVGER